MLRCVALTTTERWRIGSTLRLLIRCSELMGKGTWLAVLNPGQLESETEPAKKPNPTSLVGVEPLGSLEVLKVFVVFSPHNEGELSPHQTMVPFLKGQF